MALSLCNSPSCAPCQWRNPSIAARREKPFLFGSSSSRYGIGNGNENRATKSKATVKASCFRLPEEPILQQAIKEPVAFMGGMFAGVLRLDLNEDPLKEWVTRTVEAAGMTEEEIEAGGSKEEENAPQQIEIE